MDGSFLLILLGLGALLALGDFFSSSNDDTNDRPDDDEDDDETPDDRTRAPLVMGTQGDDLIFSGGGEVVRGWSGDDTLITDGDSTLRGGSGDDTLMSIGGGALLRGGDGEDTFIIAPVDFTEDGELLNRSGATVEPTVIVDFNPDEDRLVLNLRGSAFIPADGEPVILTGVAAPDGEGMMVQVNGVNVVQLSSYGGEDMQAALEALVTDFDALELIGAQFVFPDETSGLPPGIELREVTPPTDGNPAEMRFFVTDAFEGGGEISAIQFSTNPALDLSEFSGNASIFEDDEGRFFLQIEGEETEPSLLTNFRSFILGPGENTVAIGTFFAGGIEVTASEGVNTISGLRGTLSVNLLGGTNTVDMADNGQLNIAIEGGDNTILLEDTETAFINILDGATGSTTMSSEFNRASLTFLGETEDLEVVITENGGLSATWEGGDFAAERAPAIFVEPEAIIDASALDPALSNSPQIYSENPNTLVIGSAGSDFISGQGRFFGGDGDDDIEIVVQSDGGAVVDGGAGDDFISVYQLEHRTGDIVLTGGEGQDSFYIATNFNLPPDGTGVMRITDFEDDESIRIDVVGWSATPDMPQIPVTIIADAQANQVEIRLGDRTLVILENRLSVPPDAIRVFDAPDL